MPAVPPQPRCLPAATVVHWAVPLLRPAPPPRSLPRPQELLEGVVTQAGTGLRASIPGYRVAGKTGTAWKASAGGYATNRYVSVFAGLAPASDPRLSVVVVIDEPSAGKFYGGDVAAPVFASVVGDALRLLGEPPDGPLDPMGDELPEITPALASAQQNGPLQSEGLQ